MGAARAHHPFCRRMDVILVTASSLPRPDEDDRPLRASLAALGVAAETRAWDDPHVDWGGARACVIRSTWNYVRHHDAFLAWAERCAAVTRLWNPLPILRWNYHKRYLLELAQAGLSVVPTRIVTPGDPSDLAQLAADFSEVVIKPAISAGSFGTVRVARPDFATVGQAHLDGLLGAAHDVLVQPFMSSVEGYGERALVWIDGALTHAVRKSPRFVGDPQWISDAVPIAPDEAVLAEAILAVAARQPLLYARVDLARDERGRPCLMELELIEPSLFLDRSPAALARMAGAIQRLVT
jgi:glutathione synthase/RimK-type ligase-like ATP-grasp enzyme